MAGTPTRNDRCLHSGTLQTELDRPARLPVAAVMIDRLFRHAEVIALKEAATASKTEASAASPPSRATTNEPKLVNFTYRQADRFGCR